MKGIYPILVISSQALAQVSATTRIEAEPNAVDLEGTSNISLEPASNSFFVPTPWQLGFLWGAIAGLAIATIIEFRAYRSRRAIQELEDCRSHFEDDFVPHGTENFENLHSVMEALDTKNHGTLPQHFLSTSTSSFRPTTTHTSSDGEDLCEKSLPSVV
jgi:hypothetical protein